jgi:hypothetical protein
MTVLSGELDFSCPPALLAAMAIALLQPMYLFPLTRLPTLAGRNALQFLISSIAALVLWAGAIALVPSVRPASFAEGATGVMALGAGALFYLEIWGLMSRGYTLGVLLTIHGAGGALSAAEIRRRYRGGDGLDWIMRHRLGGMVAAGVLQRKEDRLTLTRGRGLLVARLYAASLTALGLKKSG